MTAFGKILAFINLGFSIAVGILGVLVYITRVNYASEYTKLKDRFEVLVKSRDVMESEVTRVKQKASEEVSRAEQAQKAAQAQVLQFTEDLKVKSDEVAEQKKGLASRDAAIAAADAESKRRDTEVKEIKTMFAKEVKDRLELVSENNKLREETTAAKIDKESVQKQNERLVQQLQDMARDLEKIKSQGGGTGATVKNGKNPPPEGVEGLVKSTTSGGLVTISIGSDAGLQRGHTLEVFRLSTTPGQSRYLGTIRILELSATEAVGQPVRPLNEKAQTGDRVASKILGS